MKPLAISLLSLFLSSCSTKVFDANGRKLLDIQSDAAGVSFTKSAAGDVTFSAERLSNSTPVSAAGRAIRMPRQ